MIRERAVCGGQIPGRVDRCVLDKIELVLRAWRPAIGGRCSSVGSRLSTKQTHVYIGDADSATPASKYPPPWGQVDEKRCDERVHEPRTNRANPGLIHPRENLDALDFFFVFALSPRSRCLLLFSPSSSSLHVSSSLFFSSPSSFSSTVLLQFVFFSCVLFAADNGMTSSSSQRANQKASHTSYRLVVS